MGLKATHRKFEQTLNMLKQTLTYIKREAFKNPAHAKPDVAGQQNLSALEKMHKAIEKAVAETS